MNRFAIRCALLLCFALLAWSGAAAAADVSAAVSSGRLPDGFAERLGELSQRGVAVQALSISNTGEWVIVSGRGVDASPDLRAPVREALDRAGSRGQAVEAVALQGDRWVVAGRALLDSSGVTPEAERAIRDLQQRGERITSIALVPGAPRDWAVTGGGRLFHSGGVPAALVEAAAVAARGGRAITGVAVASAESWVLVAGGWFVSHGAPPELLAAMDRLRTAEDRALDRLELRPNGGWVVVSNGGRQAAAGPDRIESEMGAARQSIYRRMQEHQVTGLAVSWIDGGRLAWSRSWGLRDAEDAESFVYPETVFEAASLAKPVTSAAALTLAGGGGVGLLEDLSQRGLGSMPELFQGRGPGELQRGSGVNLYLLLSHCAGLGFAKQTGDEDETGVEAFDATTRIPTLRQVLTGTGPASPDLRAVQVAPAGQRAIYSGVNHTMVQAVMDERAPGGFAGHMRRFLADAGMERSGFEQPMPERVAQRAAYGHRRGRRLPHQARPAAGTAGLWSTADDLARFVMLLNGRGSTGGRQVIPAAMVDAMLGRDPGVDRLCADRRLDAGYMGLGIFLERAKIGTPGELFWHRGTHGGYRAYLFGLPGRRQGLAVTMSAGARDADAFARELLDAVAREYGLPRLPE